MWHLYVPLTFEYAVCISTWLYSVSFDYRDRSRHSCGFSMHQPEALQDCFCPDRINFTGRCECTFFVSSRQTWHTSLRNVARSLKTCQLAWVFPSFRWLLVRAISYARLLYVANIISSIHCKWTSLRHLWRHWMLSRHLQRVVGLPSCHGMAYCHRFRFSGILWYVLHSSFLFYYWLTIN